ncbi:c-type cytochrome [Daejeonella sp.]|jgi:glucose/arabinose dehydrogenase|uniref:c-type cytochrome n=1 Tax=Daejeonella sp. TaxID=2805397 RepID=UPI0037C16C8E
MKIYSKFLPETKLRAKLIAFLGLAFLVTISFMNSGGKSGLPQGDSDNGGLALPGDFEAVVVVDSIGRARHLAVNSNGDIYVKLRVPDAQNRGSVALRDNNNDGKADLVEYFGDYPDTGNYGTAMRIHKGYLYFSTAGEVLRTKLTPGKLVPEGKTETIVVDNYKRGKYSHIAKPITFDLKGNLYVPFGSPSDVCQVADRQPGSPGQFPCPELEEYGGVWKFSATKLNQKQSEGTLYATGIRSIVGMDWNKLDNSLYAMQHGRDDMYRSWSNIYSSWQSALLPSEEFLKVPEGSHSGWPYTYYDFMQGKKLMNPEYGGDGKKEAEPGKYNMPLIGFPGHFAPNDLLFYTGDQFPERYKNGAFVAFHGSTIRAPYPQGGYCVAFVPFVNGKFSSEWELFADGFGGVDTIVNTSDAKYRPMGIAQGPDGSLYLNDSEKGKIWRVMYKGDKKNFGTKQLAGMAARKLTSPNVKTPDPEKDNLMRGQLAAGSKLYNTYCASCHQQNGKGDGTRFPPVAESEWVNGDKKTLIELVLNGLSGPITVKGVGYNEAMPPHSYLKDTEIAQILTYLRSSFGNNASFVSPNEVARYRKK